MKNATVRYRYLKAKSAVRIHRELLKRKEHCSVERFGYFTITLSGLDVTDYHSKSLFIIKKDTILGTICEVLISTRLLNF